MLKLNFKPFPELLTERLILRQITQSDLKSFFELRSNKEVMEKLDKEPAKDLQEVGLLIEKINTSIEQGIGINWAVCLKEDNVQIGSISFHNIYLDHHRAEIGYALLPMFHRQGLIQEAMSAALEFGFNKLGFHSIEAKINPLNSASKGILEKNGFTKEAHLKESFYFRNRFSDTAIYSLINPKP